MTDSGTDESPLLTEAGTPAGDSVLQLIEGELPRTKTSLLYRVSLVVVSFAMILLPVIYFAVVGLFGYGIYYYATHCTGILEIHSYGPRAAFLKLMLYLGPIIIGLILVFFLVKPLFAPKREPEESFQLNHTDAPQLFALIGWICQSLDAPIPSRVDIDLQVNAGAGFRGGFRSLFGNDMILEIGLPLVAGLNLSQFAAVIAHEYGHFSQGAAMRAGYLIRLINGWFFRVVYERDQWDATLIAASEEEDQGVMFLLLLHLARFGVWCGRRFLWVLMWIGHALSSFMSRQMEFDADSYEIRMCGSETFVTILPRLQRLGLGAAMAEKQMVDKWKKEKKLFDHIPSFILSQAAEIPADVQGKLHSAIGNAKTGIFDSHPSDSDRIRRGLAANEPGIIHSTAPATTLFADFSELSRRVTVAYYRDMVGPNFTEQMLVPTERTAAPAMHDHATHLQNVQRYFLGLATSLRPIVIPESKPTSVRRSEDLVAAVRSNREAMTQLFPAARAAFESFHAADTRFLQALQAAHLLNAGFAFDPADFNLPDNDLERAQSDASQAMRIAGVDLYHFEEAARARLTDTTQLLRLAQTTSTVPDSRQLEEQTRELIFVLSRLGPVFEPLFELRKDCAALEILLHYRRYASADNLTPALENVATSIQERVNLIQKQTSQIRYPFDHAIGQIFVSHFLRNTDYHADPFELALLEGRSHVDKMIYLHQRVLGNLIVICEHVEKHAVP